MPRTLFVEQEEPLFGLPTCWGHAVSNYITREFFGWLESQAQLRQIDGPLSEALDQLWDEFGGAPPDVICLPAGILPHEHLQQTGLYQFGPSALGSYRGVDISWLPPSAGPLVLVARIDEDGSWSQQTFVEESAALVVQLQVNPVEGTASPGEPQVESWLSYTHLFVAPTVLAYKSVLPNNGTLQQIGTP